VNPAGESVKISQPSSVVPTMCSNCAERLRSRVTAVQPSSSTFTSGRPALTIGSTVNTMPGWSVGPSPSDQMTGRGMVEGVGFEPT